MVRWLGPLALIVTTTACGARSQLRDPGAECEEVAIGLLGNPGAYDTSADFEGWLRSGGARVERLLTTPGEALTAETLEPFDVVVLDWLTRDYTAEEPPPSPTGSNAAAASCR